MIFHLGDWCSTFFLYTSFDWYTYHRKFTMVSLLAMSTSWETKERSHMPRVDVRLERDNDASDTRGFLSKSICQE